MAEIPDKWTQRRISIRQRRQHGHKEEQNPKRMNEFPTKRASHNGRNVVDISAMTGADSYKINATSKAKMPHEENVAALIRLSEISPRQKMPMIADLEHSC